MMWLLEIFKWIGGLFPARSDRREDFRAVTDEYAKLVAIINEQRAYFEDKLSECRKDHESLNKRLADVNVTHAVEIAGLKGQIKELSEEVAVLRAWKHKQDPVQTEHVSRINEAIEHERAVMVQRGDG